MNTPFALDRRTFIKAASALSAASLLHTGCSTTTPGSLAGVVRPKKPAVVRGAFFYPPLEVVLKGECEDNWSKHQWCTWPGNQFKPEEQQAKFMAQLQRITAGLDLKLVIDDKPLYTAEAIKAFMEDVAQNKPDALLLFNFWNSFSRKVDRLLDMFDGPIILYHPVGANHQLPPKKPQEAPRVQYIHSIENWNALERGLRSIHTRARMSQSLLLRVSGKPEKDSTEKFLGTTLRDLPAEDFNDLFDKTRPDSDMEQLAKIVRRQSTSVMDLSDKAFADAVRAHAAVLKLMERHKADAITIKCLFLKHRKPCLSFAINNGNLIPCGCENHLDGALSLMIGMGLFGRGGFLHNPEFDTEENLYFASHCTCTSKLHGPKGKKSPFALRPFFHQMPKTLALDVQWPEGEPATLFKYHSGQNKMSAWSGTLLGSPGCPPTGGCATRALVKMDDVKDVRQVYPGPHPILYCGNFTRNAKVFAKLYGLEVTGNG